MENTNKNEDDNVKITENVCVKLVQHVCDNIDYYL